MATQNAQNMYLEPKPNQPRGTNGAVNGDAELGHSPTGQSQIPLTGGAPIGRQISVTLTPEQFEQLYLQPGGVGGKGDLSKRFGNPTPLGIVGFLLSLTPLSIYLMGFGGTTATSGVAIIGAFYFLGGLCMVLSGLLEWVLGNTFPFVVFTSFGGYWLTFGMLNDPSRLIITGFTSAADPAYNDGIAVYLICWGVIVFIYLLGSLRTNVTFVILFTVLDIAFYLLAAGYFRISEGRDPTNLFIAGGAFAFLTTLCGWWILLALILGSTGMPFSVPLGDLSGFLAKKH